MVTAQRVERTLARDATVEGISFISGLDVQVRFRPAPAGSGIVFVRRDLPGQPTVPAHVRYVIPRQRRTTLRHGEAIVEMVEHVLAALSGMQIDNCAVEIDGPETPGCDGSSLAFAQAIDSAGVHEQASARDIVPITQPLTVREAGSSVTAHPGEGNRLVLSYNLDYGPDTPIGSQSLFLEVTPETFLRELAPSRTFLLAAEAKALRQAGVGLRTTEQDLLIFGPEGPINNALRYPDECVRHKILDMVGDLALLGKDLAGHVVAHRSGHQLNTSLVRALIEKRLEQVEPPVSSRPLVDIAGIMRVLPHRYPFLLIDRVIENEPGRRVVAVKNVSVNEPFFMGHWPTRPIMPGVLIIEAMAQAAGLLLMGSTEFLAHEAVLTGIDQVRLRRQVVPGDQLKIEVVNLRYRPRFAEVHGVARVDSHVVAEGKIRFMFVESARVA